MPKCSKMQEEDSEDFAYTNVFVFLRAQVTKCLIVSHVMYQPKSMIMYTSQIKEFENVISTFIWDGNIDQFRGEQISIIWWRKGT